MEMLHADGDQYNYLLNKNFALYPIVRSYEEADWVLRKNGKKYDAWLHDNRVRLSLPADIVHQHPDILYSLNSSTWDVLSRLTSWTAIEKPQLIHDLKMAEAKKKTITRPKRGDGNEEFSAADIMKMNASAAYASADIDYSVTATLQFDSTRNLIGNLGRADNRPGNYAAIRSALLILSHLEVKYFKWVTNNGDGKTSKRERYFKPFIEKLEMNGRITIKLRPSYMATTAQGTKYFVNVPIAAFRSEIAAALYTYLPTFTRQEDPSPHSAIKSKCPVLALTTLADRIGIRDDEGWRIRKKLKYAITEVNKRYAALGGYVWHAGVGRCPYLC